MLQGMIYDPSDQELISLRQKCHRLCRDYNNSLEEETEKRAEILRLLDVKHGDVCCFQGPIYFDYGCNITVGNNFYSNFNFTILDSSPVIIGENVFIGPGVSLVTPIHPLLSRERNLFVSNKGYITDKEYAKPIIIKDNCWIASNVIICGGVTIEEGCVIGAGSVVTKSIPKNSFAAGNPCKVIREINEDDSIYLKKGLFEDNL